MITLKNQIAGKVSKCSGIVTTRDYQVGLEMAWHGGTIIVSKIERDSAFAPLNTEPLFRGELLGVDFEAFKKKYSKAYNEFFGPSLENREGKLILGNQLDDYRIPISGDDNKPSGIPFKESYHIFDPRAAWDWMTEVLSGTKFTVESAGMLHDRTTWFISTKLEELEGLNLKGHKWQFGFFGALDKTISPTANLSNIRAVCANTVRASLASGDVLFKARLTADFQNKLNASKIDVEKIVGVARVWNETYSRLENTPTSPDSAMELYAGEFVKNARIQNPTYSLVSERKTRTKKDGTGGDKVVKESTRAVNQIGTLFQLFQTGKGNGGKNLADVVNGFTEYHTRGTEDSVKDQFKRYQSSEYGQSAERKQAFFEIVADDTKRAELSALGKQQLEMSA